MKFTTNFYLYSINDDNTITLYVLNEVDQKQYIRAKARFDVLGYLAKSEQHSQFVGIFGLAYQKGVGLVLQLIEVREA